MSTTRSSKMNYLPPSRARLAHSPFAAVLLIFGLLSACGGGGGGSVSSPATPIPPLVSANDPAGLLDQATFGVTASDVAHVQTIGINAYLDEQIAAPSRQYTGYSYPPHTRPTNCDT